MKRAAVLPRKTLVEPGTGLSPAVALVDPKYGHNVAAALRNCAVLGMQQLWVSGERAIEGWEARGRLPREERMKIYGDVAVCLSDRFLDAYKDTGTTIVGVEVMATATPLAHFEHPEDALYVFGPEDGSLDKVTRMHCHQFVILPTSSCLNLAVAVGATLTDRRLQRQRKGLEPVLPSYATTDDQRGFLDSDEAFTWGSGG
jgi:tRNA(Leu) C34 or U34 (ribose-2'-O)-methylase TrmL